MVETTEARWQRHVDDGRRYVSQGDYAQAEQSLLAAVKDALALGPADLRVASSLGILGKLKHRQGERERAQAFLERALAVREEALGPDHYGVVQGLNDLASLHYAYGRLAEARTLFERSLAIAEKQLAPDHGDIALALYNLSRLYFKSGDHLRAEPLLTRLLDLKERTLGGEHTDVAAILTALSRVRSMAGRHDDAEVMARRALAIREKALPHDDPAIAISLELVAYFCAGRAKRMQSLADAERILGGGSSKNGAVDLTAGDDALATQLALLASEERALRDRAREIRSRSGERREPTTLERSPEPVVVAHATESSTAPAPIVARDAGAEAPESHPASHTGAAAAAPEAQDTQRDTQSAQDSWRVWQGPASWQGWQDSATQSDARAAEHLADAQDTASADASGSGASAEHVAEPEIGEDRPTAALSGERHELSSGDADRTPEMQQVRSLVYTSRTELEEAEPERVDAEHVVTKQLGPATGLAGSSPASQPSHAAADFTQLRRGRWVIGVAVLALIAAGGAGFAMGRGAREPVAMPLAALEESSRGVIEQPQAGSLQSTSPGDAVPPAAEMTPPPVRVAAPAPTRRLRSTARGTREARLPSRLQARRMTRTMMERTGAKVMKGVEMKADSIGRSVELPPPKFGQP